MSLDGQPLPGWWTNHDTADHPSSDWAGGHGNLGMAHGISGPLALLSIATRRNVDVPGQADAIGTICTWLDQWRQGDGSQAWWPGFVSMTELSTCTVQQGPQRPSWCYGTPGMARAQQLAALALGDRRRQRDAEQALVGCITNNSQLAQLTDTSLCHGWAGLMQATWRSAADAGSGSQLAAHLPALSARLDRQLQLSQQPLTSGLLEGTAGVQLVQATTASIDPPVSDWDACLLLDG